MLQWYRTGTVDVTNGSPTVVGSGTYFTQNANAGDVFVGPDNALYEVTAVTDDTHLQIAQLDGTASYAGGTLVGQAYAIIRNFTNSTSAELAAKLTSMVNAHQNFTDEMNDWKAGTVDGGPNNDGQYPMTDPAGTTTLVDCLAKIQLLSSGAFAWATTAEDVEPDPTNYPGEYSAKHHANKAAASAGTAATDAGTATTKAGEASASATAAATSEANAATSEDNAAASEAVAAAAATALAEFQGLYHGPLAAAPTVGVDVGDLYFDTVAVAMKCCTATGPDTWEALTANAGYTTAVIDAMLAALTPVGKQTIWVPAGAIVMQDTNGAAPGSSESTTNKVMLKTADFDPDTEQYGQFHIFMPKSYGGGVVYAYFLWTVDSGTGNVVWGLSGVAVDDDDALDASFGSSPVEVTDGVTAAGDLMKSALTSGMTIQGTPAGEKLAVFRVHRKAADAADTLTVNARLLGLALVYLTTKGNDD